MVAELKKHLTTLGLSAKEADVYLSMLQSGPSTIQDIARRAEVNRSTTYFLIDALIRHGLVSKAEQGKKTIFTAESPERLVGMVVNQLSAVQAKQDVLQGCMPGLLAMFNAIADKPRLRFFEGAEGLAGIREEIVRRHEPLWEATAIDEVCVQLADIKKAERIEVSTRIRRGRVLMAIKPGLSPPLFDIRGFEVREMDYARFPFTGTLSICGNVVYVIAAQTRPVGFIMESMEVANLIRAIYEAAWSGAKPWKPPVTWYRK